MSFEYKSTPAAKLLTRTNKYLLMTSVLTALFSTPSFAAHQQPSTIFAHRSIWAVRWAAAHPAEEAAYLAHVAAVRHQVYIESLLQAKIAKAAAKPSTTTVGNSHSTPVQPVAEAQVAGMAPQTKTIETSTPTPAVTQTAAPQAALAASLAKPTSQAATPSSGSARLPLAAEADERTESDVTLDFVAADINDVIKALAVQTGANIVTSTDVKGTITISLAHVSIDEALDMIARLSGFEYAKVGTTYVVGTADGIAALTGAGENVQPVTDVVTFNYANFDDIQNTLKARYPNLRVDDGSSISGDKDGAQYKAVLLSGAPDDVQGAKDLITQIDSSLGSNVAQQTTVVYHVEAASVSDLISILGSLAPNVIVTPGPSQGFSAKAPSAMASAGSSTGSSEGTSGGGGASPGATGSSQSTGTGPNLLLLTGNPDDIAKAQAILADVDVQPQQIDFETKVTEIDVNKVNNLGLNWNFSGATTRIGEEPDDISDPPATLGNNGQSNLLGFGAIGRTAISDLATISLDALITNGDATLLADPNISALNGQPAEVFIGNTVNYVESITQTTTGENITTGSIQVGVILRVTGKVGPDGYITLNIHPEVSEITGELPTGNGAELPEVSSRYVDTTLRVKNGETIAIGGLIQTSDSKNQNSVPGLGNLPIVGKLFQDNQDNKIRTEVVFLLTTKLAD